MQTDNPAKLIAETLFESLAKAIVVQPDKLSVTVKHGVASSAVAVHPDASDAGVLIGKKGRTIRAMQLLAHLVGEKYGYPVSYSVETNPGVNPPPASRPFVEFVPERSSGETQRLLGETLDAILEHDAQVGVNECGATTVFEVVMDGREPQHECELMVVVPELAAEGCEAVDVNRRLQGDSAVMLMLNTIFSAVGRMHGRRVEVQLIRRPGGSAAQREEPQPDTAAGRFAQELGAK